MIGDVPPHSSVLLMGHDTGLLTTRRWLLERLGCVILTAQEVSAARALLLQQTVHLMVMCQSLSAEECIDIAAFAGEHAPQARLLVLFSRSLRCSPEREYVLLDTAEGPEAFVKTVQAMLPWRSPTLLSMPAQLAVIHPSSAAPR